jgi:uncharacterized integral membrane protein
MAVLFLALVILAGAVIFSAQNANPVTLSFIKWQFSASLAIVVFLAMLAGMVIMGLFWFSMGLKKSLAKGTKQREPVKTDVGKP